MSNSTGVNDSIVNQLLSKIDGVDSLNNILVIGMTNRKDMIDDAVLRESLREALPRVREKTPSVHVPTWVALLLRDAREGDAKGRWRRRRAARRRAL